MNLTKEEVQAYVNGDKFYIDYNQLAKDHIQALDMLEALDRRGGLGLEWHALIRQFLSKGSESK